MRSRSLYLHEPSLARMSEPAELIAEAASLKARGTIRLFGLSGEYASVFGVAAQHGALADIVQVPEDQWRDGNVCPRPDLRHDAARAPITRRASARSKNGNRQSPASAASPSKRIGRRFNHTARPFGASGLCCS